MNCADLNQLLSERSVGELDSKQRAAVDSHVATCDACREKWGRDAESQMLHDAVGDARSHARIRDRVMAQIEGRQAGDSTTETGVALPEVESIEGFKILGRLGRGGMGTIFRARQLSMDRVVALKVLAPHLAQNEEFVTRFVREAHTAAAVAHPNIIEVYDIGQNGDTHYIAMEFIDGESLKDVIAREGRVSARRACDIMRQVAMGLAEAHGAGILHRDIKPSNILLTKRDLVKVADFGLAKRPGADVSVTETGQAIGTPLYFPPEAARGQPLDARSDLYSFGATFYHALAGRPPFEGGSATELALKHTQDEPLPLERAAPDVPRALCGIIDRLLRKNPVKRFQSAQELLTAIESVKAELPREETTLTYPAPRASAWRRRLLVLVIGLCLLGALALVLLRGSWPTRTNGKSAIPDPEGWVRMFDGASLRGWEVVREFTDGNIGAGARAEAGRLVVEPGAPWSGVKWTGDFPSADYEVELDAMRVAGQDCFCMLTFPVRDTHLVLIIGGWGGSSVAVELVDGEHGNANSTARRMSFESGRWYAVRVRVAQSRISVWINGLLMVELRTTEHVLAPSGYGACLLPFGVGTASTEGAYKNIRYRRLEPESLE